MNLLYDPDSEPTAVIRQRERDAAHYVRGIEECIRLLKGMDARHGVPEIAIRILEDAAQRARA